MVNKSDEIRKAVHYLTVMIKACGQVDIDEGAELEAGVSREFFDEAVRNLVHMNNGTQYCVETIEVMSTDGKSTKFVKTLMTRTRLEWEDEKYIIGRMYILVYERGGRWPCILCVAPDIETITYYWKKYKDILSELSWIEVPMVGRLKKRLRYGD